MCGNMYEGVIEDWKFDLMMRRARRLRFRGDDLEDALQDLVMELIAFRFDPQRAGARKESTVLTELIDHRLLDMRKKRARGIKRDDTAAKERQRDQIDQKAAERVESKAEIAMFASALSPFDQRVLDLLQDGMSVKQISEQLDCRWHTARNAVGRITERLREKGLIPDYLDLDAKE